MKLGILTSLWQRPQLTKLFLDRLKHLHDTLDITCVAVGTDHMYLEECVDREILYVDYVNKPLGIKWNHGIRTFKDLDVTHIMILGSDDFVSDDFVKFAMEFSEDKDFTGCKDLYMFGAHPRSRGWQELFYFAYQGCIVGPGRCYSKRIVEMMNWTPWGSRNAGLDGSIARSVRGLGKTVRRGAFNMRDEGLFMVDIKTVGNISGIPGAAKPIDKKFPAMIRRHLPEGEANNLIKYLEQIEAI